MHKATFQAFATWRTDAAAGPPPPRYTPLADPPGDEPLRAPPRARARLRRAIPPWRGRTAAPCA